MENKLNAMRQRASTRRTSRKTRPNSRGGPSLPTPGVTPGVELAAEPRSAEPSVVDADNREREEDDEDHLFASIEELADFTKACSRRVGSCERDVASVRALHRAHAKRVDDSHDALRDENAGWRDVTGERLADDFKQAVKSSLDNLVHFGHESWTALVEESASSAAAIGSISDRAFTRRC